MELDLRHKKVSCLFWQYVIPSVLTMTALSLYYVIDSIYVGHGPGLGDHAIGAMGIVLPVINFLGAIGTLVSVGATSRIALFWGGDDKESVYKVMGTSVLYVLIASLILVFLVYLFSDPLLHVMGATPETVHFAEEFMVYYLPAAVMLNLASTLTSMIRVTGYPKRSMNYIAVGVFANLFFAPLYIFVFQWGIKGAALATLSSALFTFFLCIKHFMNKDTPIRIHKKDIKLNFSIMKGITTIGLAPFIILTFNSLSIFLTNNRLSFYGGAVSLDAYTIANRVTFIFIMLILGLSQGIQPIVGYNFGAGNYVRVVEVLKYTYKIGLLVGFGGMLIGFIFTHVIVGVFNPTDQLMKAASFALRILTITLPLSAFQMISSSFFQNIAMPAKALFLNLSRQLLFLAPMLFILPLFWGVGGVWMSLPLSEVLASALTVYMLYRFYKRTKSAVQTE